MEKRGITKEFDENDNSSPIPVYQEDPIDKFSKRVVKQIKKASRRDDNANTSGTVKHC